jgi:hypothetical protein
MRLFAYLLSDVSNTSNLVNYFWVIIPALKIFVQNNNSQLPVSYSEIPDIDSTTQTYLTIRKCYVRRRPPKNKGINLKRS